MIMCLNISSQKTVKSKPLFGFERTAIRGVPLLFDLHELLHLLCDRRLWLTLRVVEGLRDDIFSEHRSLYLGLLFL